MSRRGGRHILQKLISAPYIVWAVIFVVVPLFMVIYYTFTDKKGSFTFDNVSMLFTSENVSVMLISLAIALIATVACLLVGFPLAYMISKMSSGGQTAMMLLMMLPMWMNFVIRTNAIYILTDMLGFSETYTAAILGMVYNFLPYMVLPIYSVISKLDISLFEAAHDLGCNKLSVFAKVLLPLSMPGIVSGITMVFVPSVSTFYISQKLGGGMFATVGDKIEGLFMLTNNYNLGSAFSLVLLILIIISMAIMNKFTSDDDEGGMLL